MAWLETNGAARTAPDGWAPIETYDRVGYENSGGETFGTFITQIYELDMSGPEIAEDLDAVARAAGWELKRSSCSQLSARIEYGHIERPNATLRAILTPTDDDLVTVDVTARFGSSGLEPDRIESMECLNSVVERVSLNASTPRMVMLTDDEIVGLLTAEEVEEVMNIEGLNAVPLDGSRANYLIEEEFILTVESVGVNDIPELIERERDETFLVEDVGFAIEYRVGVGDSAVELVDYTRSDFDVIEQLAEKLRN